VILEIPSTVARDSFSNVKEKEYSLVVGELGGLSSLISHYLFIYFIWFFIQKKKEKKEKKRKKKQLGQIHNEGEYAVLDHKNYLFCESCEEQ